MLFLYTWKFLRYLWDRRPFQSEAQKEERKQKKEVVEQKDKTAGLTPDERKKRYLWLLRLMIALAIPIILETLDYTVVATAQPRIASAFNRLSLQSYIGTIYLLTSTVFMPLFAALADVYGRHFALQLSFVFFLIGSVLSTAAQNMPMMLVGRGISGIGAAGLLTVVRTILADSRSLDTNNLQGAVLTVLYTIGYCVGPVIGGALTDISFRWVFAINLPCSVASMILVFLLLRSHTKRPLLDQKLTQKEKLLHIDWIATILFTIGGIGLLLGLNWGSNEGWDNAKVIVGLVVGAILILVTLGWEAILDHKQKTDQSQTPDDLETVNAPVTEKDNHVMTSADRAHLAAPFRSAALLPLSVLGQFDVLATNLGAFTSGMVMLVVFYFVALYFIIVSGQSASKAGVQLLYFAPGLGIGTVTSIIVVSRLRQPKYPIVLGSIIIPISLGLISMAINTNNEGQIKGFMVMAGIGVGMTFGPLVLQARYSQPAHRVAIVSALNLFFRSLGGTVGLTQCGTVTNSKVRAYFNGLPASTLAQLQGNGATSFSGSDLTSLDQITALPAEAQELVRNAFRNGVRWSFISLIPWAVVSLFFCLFLRPIADPDAARRNAASELAPESMAENPLQAQEGSHGGKGSDDEITVEPKDTSYSKA